MEHDERRVPGWSASNQSSKSAENEAVSTEATLASFSLGTGHDILLDIFSFILENLKQELIFVTCFWATSTSLDNFSKLLRALSGRALAQPNATKIRVRICFSSLSLAQKLFHTPSRTGKVYKQQEWTKKLGLPPPEALEGLDLQIKSVFMAPFSVLHPKFVIVDRKTCFLPSCNVSWETWFEGCIEMQGPVVESFLQFWTRIWCHGDKPEWDSERPGIYAAHNDDNEENAGLLRKDLVAAAQLRHWNGAVAPISIDSNVAAAHLPRRIRLRNSDTIPNVFLPSQYHRNPRFRPFPWQGPPPCPQTPLNTNLLQMFEDAQNHIFIQTPNVTSPPVLLAFVAALSRGVDLSIVTNERLMRLEQYVTAGTTTPRCLKGLIEAHSRMVQERSVRVTESNLEAGRPRIGKLRIYYFSAPPKALLWNPDSVPVSSHLKLTIVDDKHVVLGSGNMDRASWFTSQELGVNIESPSLARVVREAVCAVNSEYTKIMYTSSPMEPNRRRYEQV